MKKTALLAGLLLAAFVLMCGCTQNTAPAAVSPAPTTMAPSTAPTADTMAPVTGFQEYMDITPAEAKNLTEKEKDLVIIDVSPYYANGHIPNAISIPLETLDSRVSGLDRTKPYLVYCHGDAPSIAGAQKLVDAGFAPVYRLKGNYAAWVAAGYPVQT